MNEYRDVRTTEHEQGGEQRAATFKLTQVIWLLLGLLEAALALRIIFKLLAVNAANPFATLLYNATGFFVAPFASLASSPASGGMVLEISSILAMIVYFLIGWGLERIVSVLFYRPRGPVSVRQTVVAERSPAAPLPVSQILTTDRTTTQLPVSATQTTVNEQTTTRTP